MVLNEVWMNYMYRYYKKYCIPGTWLYSPLSFLPIYTFKLLRLIYNLTKMVMLIQKHQKIKIHPIKNSPTDNRGEIDKIKQG